MKKQLLMKTLLVAVCLGGANFAWADLTPVYTENFESASINGTTFTGSNSESGTLVGTGSIVSGDAIFGKYYQNSPATLGARASYLKINSMAFQTASIATNKAITLSFWVKTAGQNYGWNSVFNAFTADGYTSTAASTAYVDGYGAFIIRANTSSHAKFADYEYHNTWDSSPTYVDNYTWGTTGWHHLAYILYNDEGKTHLNFYIDGTLNTNVDLAQSGDGTLWSNLSNITNYVLGGCSGLWCDHDVDWGYDEIAIYDQALTAEQVAAIIDDKLNYTYTVNAVDGSNNVLKEIATGKELSGATISYAYPHYINVNGTLYYKDAGGGSNYYQNSFTLSSNNQVEKVTYTASSYTGVLYFNEAEDVISSTSSGGAGSRCSNMEGGYASSATKITTLPAGTYTIYFGAYASKSTHLYFYKNSESGGTIKDYTGLGYWDEANTGEFTLDEATNILVKGGSSSGYVFDYFIITGTPAYTVLGDPYYDTRGDYWNYKTDNATVNAGTSYSYKFINHNVTKIYAWDNFLLPVYHYNDGNKHDALQLRADWYEGANEKGNVGFDLSADYYSNTISILDGATIDMTVFYTEDNSFRMESVITTSAGAKKYYNFNLANYKTTGDGAYDYSALFSSLAPVPSSIQTALGANWCWLEVIKEACAIATTNALGYTTFSSINKLDLDNLPKGLKAYYALDNDVSDDYVTLTEATGVVPGETGLILKGEANTVYEIPTSTSEATALSGNLLVACPYRETVFSGENKYVLVNNSGTMEFQSLEEYGATIPTGKAYLNANSGAGARLSIVFEDEGATAIKDIDASNNSGAQAEGKYLEKGKIVILKNGVKFNTNGQKIK